MIFGYPASAAFYMLSFSHWTERFLYPIFGVPAWIPGWVWGVAILTLLIGINILGAKETGVFQIVVTSGKVLLILVFIYGGIQAWQTEIIVSSFTEHVDELGETVTTAALVFITFFGFEAIATNAGEIRNSERNVPRAIFISIGFVTVLYIFVILTVVLAVNKADFIEFLIQNTGLESRSHVRSFLTERGELVMGQAAWYFLGRIGFYTIVSGALLSMISAANATVLAGSRVKQAMARREHLPETIGSRHPRFGTPFRAVLIKGGLGLVFFLLFGVVFRSQTLLSISHVFPGLEAYFLGIEALAHFADFMLLAGLIGVNIALIYSRRKQPDVERGFEVPLVPWLPAIGAVSNLLLLAKVQFASLILGLGVEAIGVIVWQVFISD